MEQQVWILRNFLGELERRKVVDEGIPNEIAGEFARLKSQSTKYRTDKTFPTKTAEKQENIKKNRYKDIVPFDHTRVKLTFTSSKNETDYINANFIKGVSGSRAYIATQGPLPHTILDFLRMLWEYNVKIVVMACREFEMGKKKCERYWPQQKDQPFVCESFTVYCDSEENKGEYLTRTLRVTYRNSSRTLIQLHYVNWPDHGVPDSIPPILEMLHEMRSYQDHDDNPICIHCSAGCGRTGVLCVIDYTWNLLRKQMIPPDFNIYDLVQNMRTQRPSVVQTKEQYELVYRTIRLLFQRYLESMDAQPCSNKVSLVPPVTECDLFDLNDEMELLPHLQHLLHEERDVLVQYHKSSTSPTAVNHITSRVKDIHMEQQERHQHQTFPDAVVKSPDLLEGSRTSPKAMHLSPIAPVAKDIIQGCDELQSLNPEPVTAVAEAICMMVEDPYFNAPMTPPSSDSAAMEPTKVIKDWNTPVVLLNEQTLDLNSPVSDTSETQMSDDAPPPLPERTPESYILAVDTEPSDPCERSSFIIPPNTAAEATRELGGSPPSPVPPLPERTAESFELDTDQAPVETNLMVTPTVNLNRIGTSSEWSGDSRPATAAAAAAVSHTETKPWKRSKSLKTKMTFTVAVTHFDLQPTETLNFHPIQPPLEPQASPVISQSDDSLTPPLPDRTPESFILKTEVQQQTPLCPQPTGKTQPAPKVGMSSEWDGSSQPKKFLDVVMCRSKSVRVKNSTQEPLTVAQPFTTPPVVVAEAGSAQVGPHDVNHRHSMNASTSGNKSDKSNDKCMSRTKSLFFRHKQKTAKMASPSTPDQPGTSPATFSVFKFGFGNRFGKPKGPRSYPETWI